MDRCSFFSTGSDWRMTSRQCSLAPAPRQFGLTVRSALSRRQIRRLSAPNSDTQPPRPDPPQSPCDKQQQRHNARDHQRPADVRRGGHRQSDPGGHANPRRQAHRTFRQQRQQRAGRKPTQKTEYAFHYCGSRLLAGSSGSGGSAAAVSAHARASDAQHDAVFFASAY